MRKLIFIIAIGMMIFSLCSCDTFSAKKIEGNVVAENFCIREGDGIDSVGQQILTNTDIKDIAFAPDKQQKDVLNIYFVITEEGREKFSQATKKAAEESGYLSLWVGDKEISANQVAQQITDDRFVLGVGGIESKEDRQSLMDKLQGISEE